MEKKIFVITQPHKTMPSIGNGTW